MEQPWPERRNHWRLDHRTPVFIELEAADYQTHQPARIALCQSIDLSADGLQAGLDERVPTGAILRLCIDLEEPLYLVAEVRWCRPEPASGSSRYRAGFQFFESEGTDCLGWRHRLVDLLQQRIDALPINP